MKEDYFKIKDKVIVITGAGGLLGKHHAEIIALFGGIPILLDKNISSVKSLSKSIYSKYGIEALALRVDITKEIQVKDALKKIIKKQKKIDGLINNAANNPKVEKNKSQFLRLENFDLNVWTEDINVSLTGSLICSKYFGTEISKNPKGGSIINISSDLGIISPDQRLYQKKNLPKNKQIVKPISYSVVKFGIIGLTKYLATYWPESNVRCNAICPGGIENNQGSDFLEKVIKKIPLGRLAKADEYQSTIIWMLSEKSSYLNGSIITIDGGRTSW
tara:strand:- start:1474 stop:2298 length:825 start_codon:yes stop_codon:yes gene_type:complete